MPPVKPAVQSNDPRRFHRSLDNCITRLRLSVKEMSLVNVQALKNNRAIGVVQLNQHNLQVVIGPQVQSVKDEMASLMNTAQA